MPAAASFVTTASSTSGTKSASTAEPNVVRTPAVLLRSLIAVGTPSSGGSSPPARSSASARPAACQRALRGDGEKAPSAGVERLDAAPARARRAGSGSPRRVRTAAACSSAVRSCNWVTERRRLDPAVDRTPWTSPARPRRPWTRPIRWPASGSRFTGTEDDGADRLLYLDGNSLGRLPRETPAALARVVEQQWGEGLVGSWADWIGEATRLGDALAAGVLGARPGEVLVADSTSVNLYKLLVAGGAGAPGPRRAGVHRRRLPDRPLRRRRRGRGARPDGARAPGRHRRGPRPGDARCGAGRAGRRRRPVAGGLPLGRAGRRRRGHPAGARRRRARALGPVARGRRRADRARGAPAPTWPWAAPTSTSTAGPGAPAFLYVRRDLQERAALADPGLVRPAGPVRDGPGVRAGRRHRALRRRDAAGARHGGRRGRRPADRRGRHRARWPPRAGRWPSSSSRSARRGSRRTAWPSPRRATPPAAART